MLRAYRETGIVVVNRSVVFQFALLDHHFKEHAKLVNRFREAGRDAVVRMWRSQSR
jgi:hypothetical protein